MPIQGFTTLELTDVRTGKTERVSKHNFITNGVAEYYRPLGSWISAQELLTGARITDMFGSVLLFDSAIEGGPETFLPGTENNMLGGADYNVTNTDGRAYIGSWNKNETLIDTKNNVATFVYDFTTDQCNGVIGSVCCAPQGSAGGVVFGIDTAMRDARPTWICNPRYTSCTLLPDAYDTTLPEYVVGVDFTANTFTTVTAAAPFEIKTYRTSFTQTSLFHAASAGYGVLQAGTAFTLPDGVVPLERGSELDAAGILHLFGRTKADAWSDPFYYYEVDAKTGAVNKALTLAKPQEYGSSGTRLCWKGNYIYLNYSFTPANFYKIEIANPTNIVNLGSAPTGVNSPDPVLKYAGRIYYGYSDNGVIRVRTVLNPDTNTLSGSYFCFYYGGNNSINAPAFAMGGHPLYVKDNCNVKPSLLSALLLFLSTINNLATPVQKTSDKTMKITYTIQETDE